VHSQNQNFLKKYEFWTQLLWSVGSFDSIPGVESVFKEEWTLKMDHVGHQAVKNVKHEDGLDLKKFWKSKASSLPEL